MKAKNSKILIVLVLFCALYAILFYFVSGSAHASKGCIIVSNLGGFSCEAQKCSFRENSDILSGKEFLVYQRQEYKGNYTMEYSDRWNFFQGETWQKMYGDFLAISKDLKASLVEYQYEDYTVQDRAYLKESLEAVGVTYNPNLTDLALSVDFDGNGEKDRILVASNQTDEVNENLYFSAFLVILNGKKINLFLETSETKNLPIYNIFSILKLDDEKGSKIIVNKGYFDQMGNPSISMFQVHGNKIEEVANDTSK